MDLIGILVIIQASILLRAYVAGTLLGFLKEGRLPASCSKAVSIQALPTLRDTDGANVFGLVHSLRTQEAEVPAKSC